MAITKVTNSLVSVNAIHGTLIADNAITSVHIAQNQVTAVQIPDGSITATQLGANSVDSSELVDGSIDTSHLSSNVVTEPKIANNSVRTAAIAQNQITSKHIADGSITDTQLGSGAFTMGTITTTGQIRGPASLTIDPITVGDNTGTVVIAGNLQVDGSTTTINSTQLSVVDKKITVGKGSGSSSAANESGFEVGVGSDGASSNPSMLYAHSGTKFVINKPLDVTGVLTANAGIQIDALNLDGRTIASTDTNGNINISPHGTGTTVIAGNTTVGGNANITGNLVVAGADHTFYSAASDIEFNIGRDATQKININVDDNSIKLIAQQDTDGNSTHTYSLDRNFAGTGANNFEIQKAGTMQFRVDTSGDVSIADGDLSLGAGSGQTFIEIGSGTSGAKTWRIYNGVSWNPDALLIYNHTNDATALTIEAGKLGVNRGASSLTHALEVGSTDNKGFFLDRNTGNEPANLNEFSSYYSLSIKNRNNGSYLNFGGGGTFSSIQATDGAGSATAKDILLNPYGGQVGIGTTPTAWSSGYKSLQIGNRGFVGAHAGSDLYVGQNAYYNSGWKYEAAVAASMTQHSGGQITHFIAASGSAGAAITWTPALHIKTNGSVGIGTNAPTRKLVLYEASSAQTQIQFQNSTTGVAAGDGFGVGLDASEKGFIWNYEGNDTYIGGANGTAVTILANNDVLMGNTVVNPASGFSNQAGFGYDNSTGKVEIATTANGSVLVVGKNQSADGDLLDFRKVGTHMGSIGVSGGNNLFISGMQTGHAGLTFATNAILPTVLGTATNGTTDLGATSEKFKDLHLSSTLHSYQIKNTGHTIQTSSLHFEKSFTIAFPNGVSNQKVRLKLGTQYWGTIQLSATGQYSNQNMVGTLVRKYVLGANANNSVYENTANTVESFGHVTDNFHLGDIQYDANLYGNGSPGYAIIITHRVANGNNLNLNVKFFASGANYITNIQGVAVNSVHTDDSTVYGAQTENHAFRACGTGANTNSGVVSFPTEKFDDGNNYGSNRYTAPEPGIYTIAWSVKGQSAGQSVYCRAQKNGTAYGPALEFQNTITSQHTHMSFIDRLAKGDYIEIGSGSNVKTDAADAFQVYKIGN